MSQAGEKQGKKALVISEAHIKTIDVGEAQLGEAGQVRNRLGLQERHPAAGRLLELLCSRQRRDGPLPSGHRRGQAVRDLDRGEIPGSRRVTLDLEIGPLRLLLRLGQPLLLPGQLIGQGRQLFLASSRASFMTGESVTVDGGMMAKGAWAGGAGADLG